MKLHELLAVESSLETQADKVRADLAGTFDKKRHLFEEKRKTFTSNAEGAQVVTEEQSDIQSTVTKELAWIAPHLGKYMDAAYQVAEANTMARADVFIEGVAEPILRQVPATALLELDKRIAEIRALIAVIPTLDPAKGFKLDPAREVGTYIAREVVKPRTAKVQEPLTLYAATKEHPAQTQLISKDVVIGTIREVEWSGLITPGVKADMLDRVEKLARAVKQARSRANEVEVKRDMKIAGVLLDFVLKGTD